MPTLRRWLVHPWLTIRVQLALGAIFIAAAIPKIIDPPSFAQNIYNYRLVPAAALNVLALFLPWLELLCGVALVLGVWRRTSAILVGLMLVMFIGAIGINLARDRAVNCGCFSVQAVAKTHDQLITEMKLVILRDVGMLLMVAQLLAATAERRAAKASETAEVESLPGTAAERA
jgi:putative oxidoreductase